MGQGPQFDVSPFLSQDEGQHFDRKSLLHGSPGQKQPAINVRCAIRWREDDHTITGQRLPAKALESLLAVPQALLQPPPPPGFVVAIEGHELVVFDVPSADGPVQVTGDGLPLRIGDQTIETTESKIRATTVPSYLASAQRISTMRSSGGCSRPTATPRWTTPASAASWVSIPSVPARSCGGFAIGGSGGWIEGS